LLLLLFQYIKKRLLSTQTPTAVLTSLQSFFWYKQHKHKTNLNTLLTTASAPQHDVPVVDLWSPGSKSSKTGTTFERLHCVKIISPKTLRNRRIDRTAPGSNNVGVGIGSAVWIPLAATHWQWLLTLF